MEEDDGTPPGSPSPPIPKKVKIESEEPKELLKNDGHSKEESKGIEDDDEDGPPPGCQPPSSSPPPPLLDTITPPPSSPLPPTPPIPSSPRVETFVLTGGVEKDDGKPLGSPSPPIPKKIKMEPEEPKESLKDSDHSKEESKAIEDDDEDGPPPGWQLPRSPPPPLLDMITPPPSSPLPPTPPFPSFPRVDTYVLTGCMEENDGAPPGLPSPPIPKKIKMEPEEPKELLKDADHSKEESKAIEDEDEDGPPPRWQMPPPPLLDMITPPSSQLPPTPPIPSSPRDLNMEQQESEDEGPPPGWDSKCQPNEQAEQLAAPPPPPPISAVPSDIKMEDEQQDGRNEDGPEPRSQAHLNPAPELVQSDLNMEQQESEDEGPPPGWDHKCQPNEQAEQLAAPPISAVPSDIKMEDEQQDAQNEDGPEPRSQVHLNPAPELVQSDIKVEQEDSEDEGPPPGWDSKCLPEPELPTGHPTTPPSKLRMEDEQQDDEGPPPGWGSAPQPQSQAHSSLPPPMLPSSVRTGTELKNIKVEGERPLPPSRPQSILPTKPQISIPKPPTPVNNPETGQMVCGSCRRLLSYPRGARYVECECCLEENYVLEEHEVGQVVCGGCNVLLMYPFGAPKVRCANCSIETEIRDHNRRPPLSEQQRRVRHRHPKRVQTG